MNSMLEDYLKREKEVFQRFKDSSELSENFMIKANVQWRNAESDMVLFKNGIPFAVIEVKLNLGPKSLQSAKNQILKTSSLTNSRFGIITDNNRFFFYDNRMKKGGTNDFIEMQFDKIVYLLINSLEYYSEPSEGTGDIYKVLTILLGEEKGESIINDIEYDKSQGFFVFKDYEKERSFFQSVLKKNTDINIKYVYRYTSLDTLFCMLKGKAYRMNGIVGMNDKSETDYFNKKYNFPESTIRELNNTYISSCSFLKDDLTMWRLYGDDARGVCLEFEVINGINGFVLAPIDYAEEKNKHESLDLLKKIIDLNVKFKELDKWKHFFKPYEYRVEKEIRLMFYDEGMNSLEVHRDWVKTWSHSIINPIIDFDLGTRLDASNFPLILKKVILGPKMGEREINKKQLIDYIQTNNLNIEVVISEIDNYR